MRSSGVSHSGLRIAVAAGAALIGGFVLAAPAAAQVTTPSTAAASYDLTTGRLVGSVAALVALAGVIVGGLALARSAGNRARKATVALTAGLIERRRPFALLRASGMYLGELRRTVLLETAATMTVVSVVGAGIGMLLAFAAAQQGGVQWRWPGWDVYGLIGGGVLAALLFSLIALPLLNITTRQDDVRFE